MKFDKGLIAGSSTLLVLTLLESGDMYGYQMIEELSRRSNDAFQFQEGTLYPCLLYTSTLRFQELPFDV